MDKKVKKIDSMSLHELYDLKIIVEDVCDRYAKTLTTYATMSADPQFQRMDAGTKDVYKKRGEFASILDKINKRIEEKILIYYSDVEN